MTKWWEGQDLTQRNDSGPDLAPTLSPESMDFWLEGEYTGN